MRQVDLVQRHIVDQNINGEPSVLHGVASEVLHACHHVLLQTTRERRAELADMMRIFAVGLLRPTPRWVAQQVDAHRAGEVGSDGAQLAADGIANALFEVEVPCGTASHGHWERCGVAHHCATRTVRKANPWEPDAIEFGANEHRLVVAVVGHELQAGPRWRIAVEAPQLLVIGKRRD
ncbi:unannotated protein [freshwater metagenome]|uniref:Unannotated protein n=1 Tax=freshwater metagenome TaxID=449393 RepID=A0A6J6XRM5_9ZZZZ